MNPLIVKIFAIGLTLSQVFTRPPEQFQPSFSDADEAKVTALLHEGCGFFLKEFGSQDIDLEDVINLMVTNANAKKEREAKANPGAPAPAVPADDGKVSTAKLLAQIDFGIMLKAYKEFCKGEKVENSPINLKEVIAFYNNAFKDLPDVSKLKNLHLPEASTILDRNGQRFTEIYADNGRRHFVSIQELPPYIKQAFVAAEDKRFFEHHGVDVRGIIRAFSAGFSGTGHPQGGSTITQQVAKNLLVGDDLTFERKMREMVMATRLEKILSKDQILELYINYVFLGRASWGIEMAAQSYFGKTARELTYGQAALLAGLAKGPNYYNPDRNMQRALDRRAYVLGRMREDGYIKGETYDLAMKEPVKSIAFESPHTRAAFYFLDEVQRDARRQAKIPALTSGSFVVKSTIDTALQRATEESLQNGLADYEMSAHRALWTGPVGNLSDDLAKYNTTWQELLPRVHSKYYDIQWPLAVVTSTGGRRTVRKKDGRTSIVKAGYTVGLKDGSELPLVGSANVLASLEQMDLVHVKIDEARKVAVLQIPPRVQGAVVVLEAKTGRILAMAGGFSYAESQLNRVTQSARQPGSTLKPFIHLSALNLGYQPDTLIPDAPVNLPPIEKGGHWWTPKNYDGGSGGLVTIRQTVERSLNLPTARIMASMAQTPTEGLDYIRGITHELGIYKNPLRMYPFVLGAQPARLLDMAVAYATIANIAVPASSECERYHRNCLMKPQPYFIESIEQNGKLLWSRPRFSLQPLSSLDRVSIYQIRRITEGTVARGTAVAMKDLAGYVAGKTGTSNNQNDAWFICYTNDLVVATWVGYDSRNVKASLGDRFTGARVALPIGERIIRKSFELYAPKEPLADMPQDVRNEAVQIPIAGNGFEVLRLGKNGGPLNTRSAILRGNEVGMSLSDPPGEEDDPGQTNNLSDEDQAQADSYPPEQRYNNDGVQPYNPGFEDTYDSWQQRGRQVDPMYYQPPFFNQ